MIKPFSLHELRAAAGRCSGAGGKYNCACKPEILSSTAWITRLIAETRRSCSPTRNSPCWNA